MDAVDARILRQMDLMPYGARPRGPDRIRSAAIARALGLSRDTVKVRLDRMRSDGVIVGYQCLPNLAHLGLEAEGRLFRIADEDAKDRMVQEIAVSEGVLAIHEYLGTAICVEYTYRSETERVARLRDLALKTGDHAPARFYDGTMPKVEHPLSALDWRLLAALRWHGDRSQRELAHEVGVTERTVRRRLQKMATAGSFVLVPLLDPGRAAGLLLFELLFYVDGARRAETANAVLARFDDHQVFSYVPHDPSLGHFNLLLFAHNPAELEALRQTGTRVAGVDRVEAWLFRRFLDTSEWLDPLIEARATTR